MGKKTVLIFGLILFLIALKVNAQETVALKIQLRNFKNEVVSENVNLKIDDKSPSNKFGESIYEFIIPSSKTNVKIEITGGGYKIFYPLNNKLLIPRDASPVIEIIIGTDKDYSTLVSIYPKIKELQLESTNSQNYCKKAALLMESIKNLKEDSVIKQIKKDSVFHQLSPILNRYVNAAFDLKKFLHSFDTVFFSNNKATAMLDSQVASYNNAWQTFYFMKDEFLKAIVTYWDDEPVTQSKLNNVARDIERIHKIYYFSQFNDIRDEFINVPVSSSTQKDKQQKYKAALIKFKNFSDNSALNEELSLLEKNINELKFQLK
ncbi:MAG: hypothetical protein ABI723_07640 [Bacteroidia bacterium]